MDNKLSIPAAILVGAVIIAGAIVIAVNPREKTELPSQGSRIELSVSESDHIRGNPSAPITIVEFSDLECPFCKSFHPTMKRILEEYGDKVRWVYRHFPLDNIHPKADKEAEASECAGELGGEEKFWAYVDRVFEITPSNNNLNLALLPAIAEDVGLNRAQFEQCLASGKYAERVEAQYQEGLRLGVLGTPGSFVNGVPVRGAVPYEQLKAVIDAELQ